MGTRGWIGPPWVLMLTPNCRPSKSFSVQELDLESDTCGGGGDVRPHREATGPLQGKGRPLLTTIPKPR